jgi:hypothetical protein
VARILVDGVTESLARILGDGGGKVLGLGGCRG